MSIRVTNAAAQSKVEYLTNGGAPIATIGTTLAPFKVWIPNYRGAHIKSVLVTHGFSGASGIQRIASVWNNTAAITKIGAIFNSVGAPLTTSTIDVYGINGQGRYW